MEDVKILDLDDIVPSVRQIKINGKIYKIRGDTSVEEILKLAKYSNDLNNPEIVGVLFETIQSFFIDPIEMKELKSLGINTQLPLLISFLFGKVKNEDLKKNSE